jgi:hypothetical protein
VLRAVPLLIACVPLLGANVAADLARQIREAGLDPAACYRVRDLRLAQEDVRLFFNDGYLLFGRPVNGTRVAAVFAAEDEGGDAEVMILAPHRGERQSLASFTQSPNLNEHFRRALLLSTDGSLDRLYTSIARDPDVRKAPEMAALLSEQWLPVTRNVTASFGVRLVDDLLSPNRAASGLVFAAIRGRELGNFDVLYDPRSREQVMVGQLGERDNRPHYRVWTSFAARSTRTGAPRVYEIPFTTEHYKIEAALGPELDLKGVTQIRIRIGANPLRSLPLEISHRMQVTAARIDGQPAELFSGDSVRASAARGNDNEAFLVIPASDLAAGSQHELEIEHSGNVVIHAGNRVYYVSSRGTWYPKRSGFSTYDLTFRYPKNLTLVTPGEVVEDRTEGETRITRRESRSPIRIAGFNLGEYEKISLTPPGGVIEVYGNKHLEIALQPRMRETIIVPPGPPGISGRTARRPEFVTAMPPPPDPLARMRALANDVAGAFEFMSAQFGPAPLKTLTVSPIPGTFGQGFPGLIYLSTIAYLSPQERPSGMRDQRMQTFFSEILQAHETAHQWWGNVVASGAYQDEWVLESLANYSALMFLEKKKGARALDTVLSDYRDHLTAKDKDGKTVESAGPIIWGVRLESADSLEAWRSITYEKGSWILHMLRKRMGDQQFFNMLGELRRRFELKTLSTDEFRKIAAEFLPPRSSDRALEQFFENWVYSTGVPTLKVKYTVKGVAPKLQVSGTLTQSGVDGDFAAEVPVEISFAKAPAKTVWVRTGADSVPFTAAVTQPPVKVAIGNGILAK